jgi:Cu/Ag efflux pump CusA
VKLQFTYDLTYEEAEQKVLNRLSQLPQLPNQAQPTISPASPIGEIYRYMVRDIADVMIGNKPRLGIAGKDNDDDIVQGIVLMRRGQQSLRPCWFLCSRS